MEGGQKTLRSRIKHAALAAAAAIVFPIMIPGSCITTCVRSRLGERKHLERVETLTETIRKDGFDENCVISEKVGNRLTSVYGSEAVSVMGKLKSAVGSYSLGESTDVRFAQAVDITFMGGVYRIGSRWKKADFFFSYFTANALGRDSWKPAALSSLSGNPKVQEAQDIVQEECGDLR